MELRRGDVAVITGGASGIGLAMAQHLAERGLRLVLADIERAALDAAVADLAGGGAEVVGVPTDVSKVEQVEALADTAFDRFGAVHVLCNNAGVVTRGAAWEQSLEDWEWVIGVDLWSVIYGVRAFVPRMLAGGQQGHIVNTASMAGLLAFPGIAPYDVAKAGVVALSESLWHDLRARQAPIGVSVLCPGIVATRIGSSERNRPGATSPASPAAATPASPGATSAASPVATTPTSPAPDAPAPVSTRNPAAVLLQPEQVAAEVAAAIESEQFWILTHPAYDDYVRARAAGILDRRTVVEPVPL